MKLGVGSWVLVLVLGVVSSAGAQQLDARWAPFAGCWELIDGGATSCVAPSTAGAVTLTTIVDGKSVLEQTIVADGVDHALTEPDCTGSQRHEWSRDGRKMFGRATLRCASQPVRTVSALSLMTGDNSWLDVQAIEIAGSTSLRLRKYRRAGGNAPRLPASIAPYLGSATFTVDDVKEAHAKVSPAVLEAALAETGARFALSARELVALDDAGVPGNVIDLMIAASYPEKFQVERRAAARVDAYPPTFGPASFGGYWGLGYPYFYSYPGYDVYYRDYYSPYGYAYPGSYYYYPGPGIVVDGDSETSAAQDGDGRAVNGVGYTRVRTRGTATRSETSASGSSSARESSSGRGAMTSSGATQSSGGSSSSGSSSSGGGGSSSSSGSSDSGRTAQPR
jgi:hypothetical protein